MRGERWSPGGCALLRVVYVTIEYMLIRAATLSWFTFVVVDGPIVTLGSGGCRTGLATSDEVRLTIEDR